MTTPNIAIPVAPAPVFQLPEELIAALARRDCLIVIGAGVSAASKDEKGASPPTWSDLLKLMCEGMEVDCKTVVERLLTERDYLTAAEVVLAVQGDQKVFSVLEGQFVKRKFRHNKIHEQLGLLEQRVYMTPNYDTIFDTYMRQEFSEGVSIKAQTQTDILPWLRDGNVVVIKNHGTIDDRKTIVLTRTQYAQQRVLNAAFFRVVDALFLTKTVVFVGCGLSDPDFQLIMEDAALAFPEAPAHYMIKQRSAADSVVDSAMEKLRNIKMVYYDGTHDQLPELLKELVLTVNSRRISVV